MESKHPTPNTLDCKVTICEPAGEYSYENSVVGVATTITVNETGSAEAHFALSDGGSHASLLESVGHDSEFAVVTTPDATANYYLRTWRDSEGVDGVLGPERGTAPLPHADAVVNLAYESLKRITQSFGRSWKSKYAVGGAVVSVDYGDHEK